MLPYLKRTLTITLDTDWLWRRAGTAIVRAASSVIGGSQRAVGGTVSRWADAALARTERHYGAESRMARTWAVSTMAAYVLLLLLGFLLLYYL
jgi:multicomponent Na+:H+ antiporter subunit D